MAEDKSHIEGAHELLKEFHTDLPEFGQTVSMSFSLQQRDSEGDPEDFENWDIAIGLNSGEFSGVPEGIQNAIFNLVAGLQEGFFNHQDTVIEWSFDAASNHSVTTSVSGAVN